MMRHSGRIGGIIKLIIALFLILFVVLLVKNSLDLQATVQQILSFFGSAK